MTGGTAPLGSFGISLREVLDSRTGFRFLALKVAARSSTSGGGKGNGGKGKGNSKACIKLFNLRCHCSVSNPQFLL